MTSTEDFVRGRVARHERVIRDGDSVFRTLLHHNRGDEQMGNTWNYLDITALGRQRSGGTRRRGTSQTHVRVWIWHDEPNTRMKIDPLVNSVAARPPKGGDAT